MAILKNTTINDTGSIRLPAGTTAQRPANPASGYTRYNSTLKTIEQYVNGRWKYDPPIVENGLILNLDAAEPASYPGTGTTWIDLSGVIGNVNVQNRSADWSFQTDSATGLTCLYNNTDRAANNNPGINIPVNNGFNKMQGTLELWIKPSGAHTGGHGFFNNSDGSSYTNASNWLWFGTWDTSNALYFRQGNASTCCNDVSIVGFAGNYYQLNTWYHYCATWNVLAGRASIYRNGTPLIRRTNLPTNIPNSNPTTTGQLFNGHTRADNMQFRGYCNVYRIYNQELSDQQIQQNFYSLRSRFGI